MSPSLGLDFGTTNTVIAGAAADGSAVPLHFDLDGEQLTTFRSALCFWQEAEGRRAARQVEAGPWAIRKFIEQSDDCRFMQSLKSFAASKAFDGTHIFGRRYRFEDLLSTFFERLRHHAGRGLAQLPPRIVVGRPVEYVGDGADAQLAMRRYADALAPFGFADIRYVYEPVAAAFFYARRLTRPATILVADFGGGTTDFSVMRFALGTDGLRAEALGHSGVGVAGDNFDYRIIDNVVSPALGKGSQYRSIGKLLDMPVVCYTHFARWNLLSVLKTAREFNDMKELVRWSLEPDKLRHFVELIEHDQSYALYKAVAGAKERLSQDQETVLSFAVDGFKLEQRIRRADFERWIEPELAQIDTALSVALSRSGLNASEVDQVFLTGGSSFVPAVRALFTRRFAGRVESGDEFLSIAGGLALIGAREDIECWTVPLERS